MKVYLKKTKKTPNFIRYQIVPEKEFDPADLPDFSANMAVVGTVYIRPELVKGLDTLTLEIEEISSKPAGKQKEEKRKPGRPKKPVQEETEDNEDNGEENEDPKPRKKIVKKQKTEKKGKPGRPRKPVQEETEDNEEENEDPKPRKKIVKKPKEENTCRNCKLVETKKCPGFGADEWDLDDPDETCSKFTI